jgi:hypothetical protein
VLWEPNALDGRDAEFAGKAPEYDDTGRYMPYFSRGPGGRINVEPSVPSTAIDVYNVPRDTGHAYFSEPYAYPVNGQKVLITTQSAPILIKGRFHGIARADFMLARLGDILKGTQSIAGGRLALVSNGGVYASHPGTTVACTPAIRARRWPATPAGRWTRWWTVRRVTATIAEIAAASAEQSVGLAQINASVGQIEGITQQNAALVEEAAAAADSLQQQADRLVALVGQFRSDDSQATRRAPALALSRC